MPDWLAKFFDRRPQISAARSPMPILVGSPRSGTTLLRFMLDAHPALAIPPETGFLLLGPQLVGQGEALRESFFEAVVNFPPGAPAWEDFQIPRVEFAARLCELRPFTVANGFRLFYEMYAARFEKKRWGDKTPLYGHHLVELEKILPEARFIHLVRDGRDAAVSLRQRKFSPGHDMAVQARYWRDNVLTARQQGRKCAHYLEVRYEDLLREPAATLRQLCAFVELEFDPAMLRYHEGASVRLQEHQARQRPDGSVVLTQAERHAQQALTQAPPDLSRIGAWRQVLTVAESRVFAAEAGAVLEEFGYSRV
ncbi:MAG: hypothetical protein RL380_174 [Verrucomicrobiota bacterium]|jgi:hypothetical protein